jgi:prepilin-type processing-associated H-X9-DG protein
MREWPDRSAPRRGRVEWIVIALVLVVLVVVMTILIRQTYQTSLTVRCQQNLFQLFAAVRSYALNHGGYAPCATTGPRPWHRRLGPYLDRPDDAPRDELWACPSDGGYVGNRGVLGAPARKLGEFRLQLEVGLIADGDLPAGPPALGAAERIDWRHQGGANVIFLDGHAKWFPKDKGGVVRRHWDEPQ